MFSVYIEPEVIKGFLTPEDCNTLINYNSEFTQSLFVGSSNNINSVTKLINKNSYEISSILKKFSEKFPIHKEKFEDLRVVKYTKGGFIPVHTDYGSSNIRTHTILMYLNENYEGGETEFPNLNKQFKLNTGDILYFPNYDSHGNPTVLALHQGNVVKSGEKLICNLWIKY
jgi:Rps23 Pro-64 3,4-dihydroxylase Tpa1-like proline 4-hydroxylase